MKAAVLRGKLSISVEELPTPEVGPGDILLRVKAASICGTDVRMYKNGRAGIDAEHPMVLGHEFAGVIEEVGSEVRGFAPGQRISVAPNIGCGTCDCCASGQTNACAEYQAFGIHIPGGFAEYVRIPAKAVQQGNVLALPEDADFAQAALVEPLACVYNGQRRMGAIPGATVLIIGAGPIGIMHALLARTLGASRVFMNDLNHERLSLAVQVAPFVEPLGDNILESLSTQGLSGVDACIIAAPAPSAQAASLEYMNINGKLLFFGGLPAGRETVPINTNLIHYRQLSIFGCTGQSITDYRACSKLVSSGVIDLSGIITSRAPIDDFVEQMQQAAVGEGLKHVIEFA